jgi:hypothetical protein
MGLFRSRLEKESERASERRKVERMRGVSDRVNHGASLRNVDRSPRACDQLCGGHGATRTACTSTVRGGVCPCPNC